MRERGREESNDKGKGKMLRKTEERNDRKRKRESEEKTIEWGNGKCRITGSVRDK